VIAAIEGEGKTTSAPPTTPPPSLDVEQQKTVKKLAAEALKLGVEGIDEAIDRAGKTLRRREIYPDVLPGRIR